MRSDLTLAQQAVQAIHASMEVARYGLIPPTITHPHLVLCNVKNELELELLAHKLKQHQIKYHPFYEPDLDDSLTAIATEPICGKTRSLFRKYRLATFKPRPYKRKQEVYSVSSETINQYLSLEEPEQ